MSRKVWVYGVAVFLLSLVGTQAASAKYLYSYAVKFVCGYNNTNIGLTTNSAGQQVSQGEATVKFGNYATDINIFNFNVDTSLPPEAIIQKNLILLVSKGDPVGREPRAVGTAAIDNITLKSQEATMDDCNRIGELIWGAGNIPTPFPLMIGFLVIQSTVELDITAVYTSQACSNWVFAGPKMECLDTTGREQGVSSAIDVHQITGHRLFP
ncbi:MAG TPA: hypothetical protein VGS07_34025 [Thermoanaerobaculia bacterium]|nr:hypothetical protein [Thermoanaerobaculia bacterium]